MVTLSARMPSVELAHPADPVKLVRPRADVFQDDIMGARCIVPLAFGPVIVAALRSRTDRIPHGRLRGPDAVPPAQDLAAAAGREA